MWSHSDDAKAKIAAYRTGTKQTPKTKQKIRAARAKQKPPNKKYNFAASTALENSVLQRLMALLEIPLEERKNWLQKQKRSNQNRVLIYNINLKSFLIKHNNSTRVWLDLAQKTTNLNVSLGELITAQKQAVLQAKKDVTSSNPLQRFKYNKSIKSIARLYTDSAKRLVGGRQINLFNRFKPMWQQKNFFFLLKLKVIFDVTGLTTDTDRRQYIQGIFDQKRVKNKRDFIPLNVLSSPLCFLDYLFYLKTNWYMRFPTQDLEKDRKLREDRYGSTYYEEQMKFALGVCAQLIAIGGKSRLEMEIPHAFGSTDFCLFYCWSSPFIPKLRKLGVLRTGWPEVHKGMTKLKRRAKEDSDLRKAVQKTKKFVNKMWADSGLPAYSEEPYEDIRGIIEHVCPQHEEDVKDWLLTLRT